MPSSSVDIHQDRILILDFGSQYTQLIARRIRELGVYCEIRSSEITESQFEAFEPNGVVLSGGPESVTEEHTPRAPAYLFTKAVPVLGIVAACKPWPSNWVVASPQLPNMSWSCRSPISCGAHYFLITHRR